LAGPQTTRVGPRDEKGDLAARILEVGRASFAANGKAGTSVRAVAGDADVDPALVYPYYGSKDALLDACTTPPPEFLESVATAWSVPRPEVGAAVVRNLLRFWDDDTFSPVLPAILLIAAHDQGTKAKLRSVIENALMGPGLSQLG
jgi:AcrR family transcriptional regulator